MIITDNTQIKFDYERPEREDILRCLRTLYATKAGTQPLDREFGIDCSFLDSPIEAAKELFTLEVIEKIERYEPRVEVVEVTFHTDARNGYLEPVILLAAVEEEEEEDE